MKHDITKLDPIHQKNYLEYTNSRYYDKKVADELYGVYLELSKIPKEDWGKPETTEKLKNKTDKG